VEHHSQPDQGKKSSRKTRRLGHYEGEDESMQDLKRTIYQEMKIGSWKTINWAKCVALALCLSLLTLFATCTAFGIYGR